MDWNKKVPVEKSVKVGFDLLHFDTNNPRFTPDKKPDDDTDTAIVKKLASSADLAELTKSISTSGYINIEPLIVILRGEKLVVLEGNRRLAALKALQNPELAVEANLFVPKMSQEVLETLSDILVYRVESEDDARDLIGFKHINGPQAWDSYAKAKFATKWLDSEKAKASEGEVALSLNEIADRMGDNHSTMFRMVVAYYVLEQAQDQALFDVEDRQKKGFSFSHLYTGLTYPEFTDYLGMPRPERNKDPERNPVPSANSDELKTLLRWLYGSKLEDIKPVIRSQNPDLRILRDVLQSKSATLQLEEMGDLGDAIVTATPAEVRFSRHIITANAELAKAQTTLDGFDPSQQSDLQELAASILRRAELIKDTIDFQMVKFQSKQ